MDFLKNLYVQDSLVLLFAAAISFLAYYLVRKFILQWIYAFFRRTPTKWDQFFFEQGVFDTTALIIPSIIMFRVLPFLQVLSLGVTKVLQVDNFILRNVI